MGSGLTALAAAAVGLLQPLQAACLAAGAVIALVIAVGSSKPLKDTLYPARLRLARFRRDDKPADLLVVRFPAGRSIPGRIEGRQSARAAGGVLRVTDGVSPIPARHGHGLCAVLEPDAGARAAIEQRLSRACAGEVLVGWASCPDDGVTIDSLVEVAVDRGSQDSRRLAPPRPQRLRAGHVFASTFHPGGTSARRPR